jgi:uncharacterized protein (TIGR03435 family)
MGIRRKQLPLSISSLALIAAALAVSLSICAQTASSEGGSPVSYDVMSVRQNKTGSRSSGHAGTDDRYSSTNVSLKSVLAKVFNVKEDWIFGIPDSVDSARFDIEATITEPDPEAIKKMTREQERMLLLPLLAERFQLKTHIETRTLPVYDLVVGKSGPKFTQAADQTKHRGISGRGDNRMLAYTFQGVPMSSLTNLLTDRIHRTVNDKTGLAGNYDFALIWAKSDTSEEQADLGPTIFTALQEQLGLKLEAARGPVVTIVVDSRGNAVGE